MSTDIDCCGQCAPPCRMWDYMPTQKKHPLQACKKKACLNLGSSLPGIWETGQRPVRLSIK